MHVATLFLQIGNWLLLAGVLLFFVAVFNAARASRQSRNAAYYGIRQEALSKTRRWSVVALMVLIATGALAFYLGSQPPATAVANKGTPTPMLVAIPSKMLPTNTAIPLAATPTAARPTIPPNPTSTPGPTAAPTITPTAPVSPNLPGILLTPVPSAVPVSPNARLTFTTLASVADNKGNPVDPGLAFPSGTHRVRLYFQAANVNNGAPYSVLCYKGDQLVDNVSDLWEWGPRGQGARAFCSLDGSAGKYTVAGYLGTAKQFEIAFELLAATPTATP
jgi:hypothetical protein